MTDVSWEKVGEIVLKVLGENDKSYMAIQKAIAFNSKD